MRFLLFIFAMTALFLASGCASVAQKWKNLISGGPSQGQQGQRNSANGASYNQQNNLLPNTYRKYKRSKRKDIEDDAHLDSRSGSLWVMEGQGAYLFSQNTVRLIGDPLAVRIEGDPNEQLAAKTKVISKLLTQIEERRRRALGRAPANEEKKGEEKKDPAAPAAPGAPPAPGAAAAAEANPTDEKAGEFSVKTVPTRVIERLVDGNYRVRGVQPFLINQREYKVIVSGIVRTEDFNEEGISASQLLDANFDIVSSRSTETR